MTLAAVHLPPVVTIPVAALFAVWGAWYWWRLGRRDVAESRGRIRRASMIVVAIALPIFVAGLSFIDPSLRQQAYVRVWTFAILLLGLLVVIAGVDIVNNVRLHARALQDQAVRSARELGAAIGRARAAGDNEETREP